MDVAQTYYIKYIERINLSADSNETGIFINCTRTIIFINCMASAPHKTHKLNISNLNTYAAIEPTCFIY